ncbi:MAG TPA: 2-C-methyl-D-erythritol 2,4-cyclodiphosphate synthase [Gemmatimonadales bacterium]|nr:2-C-methyl-D-erythritol 2,4-cyclodiphosphate synthase [Gemmatimonadales bacterium]
MSRTGIGYDSHRFAAGRPLILGGITIPSDRGLTGHSDADAIAHALTDAILGAAAAGDIGRLFPDTDPRWKGADSMKLLAAAHATVQAKGWRFVQGDVTVICERPKLAPHLSAIAERLATVLGVTPDAVGVKAKTNEGMGWIGRAEGIAVMAVATVEPVP